MVPVYRSRTILPRLAKETAIAAEQAGYARDFELVLVNDACPDGSWEVIQELASEHSFVRGVCLSRNFGQHNATMAGLRCAQGDFVVIMDDDLQHPPQAIGDLVAALERGYDVCYSTYEGRQHELWKRLGSWFNDRVANLLLDKPKGLYLSSFKALRRTVVDEVVKYDGPYAYVDGLILDVTRAIAVVPIQHQMRADGKGNYDLIRSISLWLKMATSFSVLPLRVASVSGFVLALVSATLGIAVIVQKLVNPETQAGWTSLMATILFVGGLQLLGLGLIGEYLGRAYLKLNKKPQYVVRAQVGEANSRTKAIDA